MNKDFWAATKEEETRDLIGHNLPEGEQSLANLATAGDIPAMAKKEVERLRDSYKEILAIATRAPDKIENDDIYNRFTALVGQVKNAQEDRESTKKALKDPYNKASTAIENEFKLVDPEITEGEASLHKKLEEAFTTLKGRMSVYDTEKYQAEEALRVAEHERLAEAAARDGIELDTSAITPTKMGSQKSEHGGTSIRSLVDTWEVTNESLLPRSVLSIDPAKVAQLIKDGAKTIPGITISKKVDTTVRRR